MLDSLIATYVWLSPRGGAYDVCVSVQQCAIGTRQSVFRVRWLVHVDDVCNFDEPECNRVYRDRESAVLAAEALAMRLHQGGEYATAAEFNRAMELEG